MRKVTTIITVFSLLALLAIPFSSCEKYVIPDLRVSPDTLRFGAAADSQKVFVTTNVNTILIMDMQDPWVFADPGFLEESTEVTFYVLENEESRTRTLEFPVRSEALQRKIIVIQAGKESL